MTERDLFLALLDLPDTAGRSAFLDNACAGDAALRARIESLLQSQDAAGSFLGQPALPPAPQEQGETQELADQAASGDREDSDGNDLSFLTASKRPDSLGRIGHYEVLQVLGRGGFGIVFRAFDEVLQRVVALKVLAPAIAATSPARKRFLREARSSAQVRHENVVQVHAVEEQPLPYLVMEFIPGETLQQRLDRTGPLEAPEIVRIGRQIAEGLAAAHAMGLIHRDIKPGNILLEGGHQRVKITDFGLARAADDASLTQSGVLAGTPMYMAPEQAQGETLDHRADLFSLGSVLYVMATGRPPFRAATTFAVLKRVVDDDPRPIREVIPETPQWLCDIIAKLHAKKPEERFQSAREVADVLADCGAQLGGRGAGRGIRGVKTPVFSRPSPRGSRPSSAGRWKWIVAAVLLLTLLPLALMLIAGATYWLGRQTPARNLLGNGAAPFPVAPLKYGDPEYINTLGMKFKLIPAGKFTMGSSQEEIDRCLKQFGEDAWIKEHVPTEGPEHPVEITQPFYMGATAVTVGQFRQFVDDEGYQVGDGRWRNPGFDQTDKNPVVWVSWQNAVDFCKWLSAKEGKVYRLPTEAEWEYCCRAGKAGSWYCFGDDEAELENYAWYIKNSGGGTHPVGKKKPNDWGLYDMHGNVWQCCHDNYDPDYYKNSPVKDPPGTGAGGERMYRGGAWDSPPVACRSAFRQHGDPGRRPQVGFRVVLVSPPAGVGTASGANNKPAAPAIAPFTDADVQRVTALPAEQQVEAVRKALKRRNPDFNGRLTPTIEDGVVTKLSIEGWVADLSPLKGLKLTKLAMTNYSKVTDLTPLRGMPLETLSVWPFLGSDLTPLKGMPLKSLNCGGGRQKIDLTPLAGMPLDYLCVNFTQASDLTPLRGLPLTRLECTDTLVSDLTPIHDMRLNFLVVNNTKVSDLSPLQGMPLAYLECQGSAVTDLSPLKNLPLTQIRCDFQPDRDTEILRSIKTLETINGEPAAEFWKSIEAK